MGEDDRVINGKPWVLTKVVAESVEQTDKDAENFIQRREKGKPAFIPIHVSMCSPMSKNTLEKLLAIVRFKKRGYLIVRPDKFFIVYKKEREDINERSNYLSR